MNFSDAADRHLVELLRCMTEQRLRRPLVAAVAAVLCRADRTDLAHRTLRVAIKPMVALVLILGTAGSPVAARAALPSPATSATELGPRDYTQRSANKIRPGSLIRAEGAQVRTVTVELRGVLGELRDDELTRHYGRMAEMDVVVELADKHHDLVLAERVETARRKETERFFWSMQQLRVQSVPGQSPKSLAALPAAGEAYARAQAAATSESVAKRLIMLPGAIYRQALDAAHQRLTGDTAHTRLDDLELQIERERDLNR